MARRRATNVLGLAFLDAMTCGLGAVILLYVVISARVEWRADTIQRELSAEADRLEEEVLEGSTRLVRLRNTLEEVEADRVVAQGLAQRMLEALEELRQEVATFEASTLARRRHLSQLKSDLRTLEEESRRLAASTPSQEIPGDRVRAFAGDGDRQYLTGLKIGGERILILVDSSASMLAETIVNVIRRRNLPDERKLRSRKWQQAVSTVDWLSTQLPRSGYFQIYTFDDRAEPLLPETGGRWLETGDRGVLDQTVAALRQVVPGGGTSLHHALAVVASIEPRPDNVILLVDGLPTRGLAEPKRRTVSGKQRLQHFDRALRELPRGVPVNVILLPMEGDAAAASAYWRLALASRGSFFAPAVDWP